ncbi:hypothetical protein OK016_21300 [Vibrio chagasii]|nr:hypothetical protein [Vibrio chagasii]
MLTGKQKEMHLYTVKGQQAEYARLNKPIKEDGWYVVPGKIDAPYLGTARYVCILTRSL